jgi:hypothetical protein
MAVHENRIAEGLVAAEQVLSDPHAPKQAVGFAAFSAGLAMPVAGRGRDFGPIAARCRVEQKSAEIMIGIMVRYVLALTYTGLLDLADKRAADYADFSPAEQFLAWPSPGSVPVSSPHTGAGFPTPSRRSSRRLSR